MNRPSVYNIFFSPILAPARFSRTVFLAGQSEHRIVSGGNLNVRLPLDIPYHMLDQTRSVYRAWLECIWRPHRGSPDLKNLCTERRATVRVSECGRWLTLDLSDVRIQDEGLYRIWIENESGRDYFDIRIHVDDKPWAKLLPPNVFPKGRSQILLTWRPPHSSEDTVTSTGYRIEYISDADANTEDNWHLLGTTSIEQTEVVIGSQLKTGLRYRFRVRLQNLLGLGPASEPSGFIGLEERMEVEEKVDETRLLSRFLGSREPIRFSGRKFEDRYDIIEELAGGRHAHIYRIRDRETNEQRIAKIMDLGDVPSLPASRSYTSLSDFRTTVYTPTTRIRRNAEDERRLRAERELRLLASTHHKNIADLRDVFVESQRLIWVIDDMLPETLWDQIQTHIKVSESRAAEVMIQILSILESLHRRDIAFLGGVDPTDIFFTDQSRRRIVLGGASQYHKLTEDKPVRLTFRSTIYVPPEIYSSDVRGTDFYRPQAEITRATDSWASGALLYQMLTGNTTARPNIEDLEKLNLSKELLDFSRNLLHPDPAQRLTISEALKHPWITSTRHTTEEITSASTRRLEEATTNAYKRLLHKIDWSEQVEKEEVEFVDETEHEFRRRRKILEYRKKRRMSYDEDYEDLVDDGIAMNVFLRGRGRAPKIAVPMSNLDAYEGQDTLLTVGIDTVDLDGLDVEWSVNGKTIDMQHPTRRMNEKYSAKFDKTTGVASLRVRNLSVYDAGTYVATFRGRFGLISESANLRVNREFPLCNRQKTAAPLFI